jgi:hypothetical protein
MNLANHMLIMTVAMVRVSHAGMKMSVRLREVALTAVLLFENSATPHVRTAKPTIMTVRISKRRGEDLPPPPCDAS